MIEKFQISFSLAYQKFALYSSISRWLFRQFLLIRRVSKTWYIFSTCVVDSVYDCIDNKFQVSFRFRKCRTFTVVKVDDRRDKFSLTRISTADTCLPRSHRLSQWHCIDRKFQISLGLNLGKIFVSCSRVISRWLFGQFYINPMYMLTTDICLLLASLIHCLIFVSETFQI